MSSASPHEMTSALGALLIAALASVREGDEGRALALLAAGGFTDQRPLAQGVAKLARELSEAMRAIDLDTRIAGLAGGEIKDACTHLDHVVRMTEEAAHRTLDLVEDCRRIVDRLPADAAIAEPVDQLRRNLLSLALAQEYQDLSGQLIRRVIALVRQVESALVDLVRIAGPASRPPEPVPAVMNDLKGPAAANPASQQDADALLADLGF